MKEKILFKFLICLVVLTGAFLTVRAQPANQTRTLTKTGSIAKGLFAVHQVDIAQNRNYRFMVMNQIRNTTANWGFVLIFPKQKKYLVVDTNQTDTAQVELESFAFKPAFDAQVQVAVFHRNETDWNYVLGVETDETIISRISPQNNYTQTDLFKFLEGFRQVADAAGINAADTDQTSEFASEIKEVEQVKAALKSDMESANQVAYTVLPVMREYARRMTELFAEFDKNVREKNKFVLSLTLDEIRKTVAERQNFKDSAKYAELNKYNSLINFPTRIEAYKKAVETYRTELTEKQMFGDAEQQIVDQLNKEIETLVVVYTAGTRSINPAEPEDARRKINELHQQIAQGLNNLNLIAIRSTGGQVRFPNNLDF